MEKIINILKEKHWHIATAESCTGGMLASSIVDVAGSSDVFDLSMVTYANEAKIKYLGVSSADIEKYGVVSEVVAKEMAIGIASSANAEIAISTSGIAGPGGGTKDKPVGMVCFAIYLFGNVLTYTKYFGNIGRNNVRKEATKFITEELYKELQKM